MGKKLTIVTTSQALVTTSQALVTTSKALVTTSKALVTTSKALVTSSKALVTTSKALAPSSSLLLVTPLRLMRNKTRQDTLNGSFLAFSAGSSFRKRQSFDSCTCHFGDLHQQPYAARHANISSPFLSCGTMTFWDPMHLFVNSYWVP